MSRLHGASMPFGVSKVSSTSACGAGATSQRQGKRRKQHFASFLWAGKEGLMGARER